MLLEVSSFTVSWCVELNCIGLVLIIGNFSNVGCVFDVNLLWRYTCTERTTDTTIYLLHSCEFWGCHSDISAYFTVWMICPPILKSPNPSRASLVRHSLWKLNRIDDQHHSCLTPLPVFILLVSPWFSRTLTLWAVYKSLINLLSRQSIPVPFRICIHLVQLTRSNAFCQSMKQTHSSVSISKVLSDILSIPIASLFPFLLLNPNLSSPSTSSISLSLL